MTTSTFHIKDLTEDWLLYTISTSRFQSFKEIGSKYCTPLLHYIPPCFHDLNIWVTVCNVWLALHNHSKPYYLDETKRMNYAAAFLQLEYFERQPHLKQFLAFYKHEEEPLFTLAFFLAMESMLWLTDVMKRADEQILLDHYSNHDNFLKNNVTTDDESFQQVIDYQKVYVFEMTRNLQTTTDLEDACKRAIIKTKAHLYKK